MLHIKNSNNWPCCFQQEVKMYNCKRTALDDGRRPIAIGHRSDSDDQKREKFMTTICNRVVQLFLLYSH